MNFEYTVESESKEEKRLIDDIAQARDTALDNDVSVSTVQTVLLLFAMRVNGSQVDKQKTSQNVVCPSCGEGVETFDSDGLGEKISLIPCGCRVEMEEFPDDVVVELLSEHSEFL